MNVKLKSFIIISIVLIVFVCIAYYVNTSTDRFDKLSPSDSSSEDECFSLSTNCNFYAWGISRGRPTEEDAKDFALAMCEARLKIARENRDSCLLNFRKNLDLCRNNENCVVDGLEEEDNLDEEGCKLEEYGSPCQEIIDNKDGNVTICSYFYNPPKKVCEIKKMNSGHRIGWTCSANSNGSCTYQLRCLPKTETAEAV